MRRQKTRINCRRSDAALFKKLLPDDIHMIIKTDFQKKMTNRHISFTNKKRIEHHLTAPHTPAQKGVSERLNRTLVEHAACIIPAAGLVLEFSCQAYRLGTKSSLASIAEWSEWKRLESFSGSAWPPAGC